jgi:hypothetical protein
VVQSLISSGTSISQLFDQDKWERHRSVRRYFVNLHNIGVSTVFRRIAQPWAAVVAIACAVTAYNAATPASWPAAALPSLAAHTLLGEGREGAKLDMVRLAVRTPPPA